MSEALVKLLREVFPYADHQARKGGYGDWFIYIKRDAIINRLDQVAPMDWEDRIVNTSRYEKTVTVTTEMTIKGTTRSYNGSADDKPIKDKADKTKIIGWNTENTDKSAATDAFKRVASSFGIGLYLQTLPKIKANNEQGALQQFNSWYQSNYNNQKEPGKPTPKKKQSKKDDKPSKKLDTTQNEEEQKSAYDKKSDFHMKVRNVFPDYHPLTTLNGMSVASLDDFGSLSTAAVLIKDHCYNSLFPVKCHYMRYYVTETQKYLEFCNDYDPKLQHGLIRAYGRSTNVKKKLDSIDPSLYAGIGCEDFDDAEITTQWKQIPQALVLSYNEGSGYYTMTDIQLPDEDIET